MLPLAHSLHDVLKRSGVESLSFWEDYSWRLNSCPVIRACKRHPPSAMSQTHLFVRVCKPIFNLLGNEEHHQDFGNVQLGFPQVVVIFALEREVNTILVQHIA